MQGLQTKLSRQTSSSDKATLRQNFLRQNLSSRLCFLVAAGVLSHSHWVCVINTSNADRYSKYFVWCNTVFSLQCITYIVLFISNNCTFYVNQIVIPHGKTKNNWHHRSLVEIFPLLRKYYPRSLTSINIFQLRQNNFHYWPMTPVTICVLLSVRNSLSGNHIYLKVGWLKMTDMKLTDMKLEDKVYIVWK